MQSLTAPAPATDQGPPAPRGRWVWRLAGLLAIAGLACLVAVVTVHVTQSSSAGGPTAQTIRRVTIAQTVTAVNVQSHGARVTVVTDPGPVKVTETIVYNPPGRPPAVTAAVQHGRLTLDPPGCGGDGGCVLDLSVSVPSRVAVTVDSDGGAVGVVNAATADIHSGGGTVTATQISGALSVTADGGTVNAYQVKGSVSVDSGGGNIGASGIGGTVTLRSESGQVTVAGARDTDIDSGGGAVNASALSGPLVLTTEGGGVSITGAVATHVDSGGGPVTANTIHGPLTVNSAGGDIEADEVTGTLNADSGSGQFTAAGLSSAIARVQTEGGNLTLAFTAPPASVRVSTGGGDATISAPGGPYALSMESDGGTGWGTMPIDSNATRSIFASIGSGSLITNKA